MGCYVFSRLDDMFQFFRTKLGNNKEKLYINTGYWGEKLEAVARHTGYHKYNPELARANVSRRAEEWITESELSEEEADELREHLEEEINYDDGMREAYRTIDRFSHKTDGHREFLFQDIFEWTWEDYTYHYVWCCFAVAWGIKQYDALKDAAVGVECLSN